QRPVRAALGLMDAYGIARALVMSPPRAPGVKGNQEYPDFAPAIAPHGERFSFMAGGGSLNPILHGVANDLSIDAGVRADFARAAREAVKAGAAGYGEMGTLHLSLSSSHGYTYAPADHPLLLYLADIAAGLDVPIDLHMDAVAAQGPLPKQLAANPKNPMSLPATLPGLEKLLAHNPKAKIVWAHGGTDHVGDFTPAAIGALMDRHANLYMSLKVTGGQANTFNKLLAGNGVDSAWLDLLRRHSDRFVIGSDSFFADPTNMEASPIGEFSMTVERRLQATRQFLSLLPPDLARKIGHQNAVSLYRLPPLPPPDAASQPAVAAPAAQGLCKDGNLDHCKTMCQRGVQRACAQLKRQ
ncbi:MAG: amidohydrolase family protein, partial [Pseudomonadota bacterium]|nr:amidohydrolase family protein [Pseudomonadota bacterium]